MFDLGECHVHGGELMPGFAHVSDLGGGESDRSAYIGTQNALAATTATNYPATS